MIWLKLLSNPLTKIIANKTIGAIQHKLEKDKIIKAKEIEATKTISVEQIRQQENSFKDEWLVVVFSLVFMAHFVPQFQETMLRGWEILEYASDYFWIIILTIVGASFGVNTVKKFTAKK
jgi:general stress protein CsbA